MTAYKLYFQLMSISYSFLFKRNNDVKIQLTMKLLYGLFVDNNSLISVLNKSNCFVYYVYLIEAVYCLYLAYLAFLIRTH